jgi:hypothetical protein
MHRLRLEASFTVFLLFFGAAMLDAIRHQEWLMTLLYLVLALLFLQAGGLRRSTRLSS